MDIYSPEFIKQLLDMTDEEALAFYRSPLYKDLSPAEKENFNNTVFKEQGRQVMTALLAGLHNLPEPKIKWEDLKKDITAS
jgi:hypothetical protein